MNIVESIILGFIQGLTEFLPVSSSGHLEISKALFGRGVENENLLFTVVVHGATVLSTMVVFRKEILELLKDFFSFKNNEGTQYCLKLGVSAIPFVLMGGVMLLTDTKDKVERALSGNLGLVGAMLLVTGGLLIFAQRSKREGENVTWLQAFIIGVAQACAILPGISRSGATIATGIVLGVKREKMGRFSFLMAIIPIIGVNLHELLGYITADKSEQTVQVVPLLFGFVAAFLTGLFACRFMIRLVTANRLHWFAAYCMAVGGAVSIYSIVKLVA